MSACLARKEAHEHAKKELISGNFPAARHLLEKAQDQWGEHIALTADIATCLYFEGSIPAWENAVEKMDADYRAHFPKLGEKMRSAAGLLLGKFREEQGRIQQALAIYQKTLDGLDPAENSGRYQQVEAQIIRTCATYGLTGKLGEIYRSLIRVPIDKPVLYRFDIQHGLALAEFHLVGAGASLKRATEVFASPSYADFEKRMLAFDMAELFLRKKERLGQALVDSIRDIEPTDPYDRALKALALGERVDFGPQAFHEISIAGMLRLASLQHGRTSCEAEKEELAALTRLLLMDLGCPKSKKIWEGFLGPEFESKPVSACLTLEGNTLALGKKSMSFENRETMLELLRIFSGGQKVEIEEAVRRVWKTQNYCQSYFDRIRILSSRLNKILEKKFGIPRLIRVSKCEISLDSKFSLKIYG